MTGRHSKGVSLLSSQLVLKHQVLHCHDIQTAQKLEKAVTLLMFTALAIVQHGIKESFLASVKSCEFCIVLAVIVKSSQRRESRYSNCFQHYFNRTRCRQKLLTSQLDNSETPFEYRSRTPTTIHSANGCVGNNLIIKPHIKPHIVHQGAYVIRSGNSLGTRLHDNCMLYTDKSKISTQV